MGLYSSIKDLNYRQRALILLANAYNLILTKDLQ